MRIKTTLKIPKRLNSMRKITVFLKTNPDINVGDFVLIEFRATKPKISLHMAIPKIRRRRVGKSKLFKEKFTTSILYLNLKRYFYI